MLALDLGLEIGIAGGEIIELDEVTRTLTKVAPRFDLGAEPVRRAQDALRRALVGPEVGFGGLFVEAAELVGLPG